MCLSAPDEKLNIDSNVRVKNVDKELFDLLYKVAVYYKNKVLPIIKYDDFNPIIEQRQSEDITFQTELEINIPTLMSIFPISSLREDFQNGCNYKALGLSAPTEKQRIALLCVAYKIHAKNQRLHQIIKSIRKNSVIHKSDQRLVLIDDLEKEIIEPLEKLVTNIIAQANIDGKLTEKILASSKKDGKTSYDVGISLGQKDGKMIVILTDQANMKKHQINITKHFLPYNNDDTQSTTTDIHDTESNTTPMQATSSSTVADASNTVSITT